MAPAHITVDSGDADFNHTLFCDDVERKFMAGVFGEHVEKEALGSPVALPEGMEIVDFDEELGCDVGEIAEAQSTQFVVSNQSTENSVGFSLDL